MKIKSKMIFFYFISFSLLHLACVKHLHRRSRIQTYDQVVIHQYGSNVSFISDDSVRKIVQQHKNIINIENVLKALPYIKNVNVFFSNNNQLVIDLYYHSIAYKYINDNNKTMLITSDFKPIPDFKNYCLFLPIIRMTVDSLKKDTAEIFKHVGVFLNQVQLADTLIFKSIDYLYLKKNNDILLFFKNWKPYFILGKSKTLMLKINPLLLVMNNKNQYQQYKAIDIRFTQQIIGIKNF